MTLKELRISKGLNQGECAKYLGMSTRNYQNYENDPSKVNTARYNDIYQRLSAYGHAPTPSAATETIPDFNTNVVIGASLQALIRSVAKYQKRDCFAQLKQFTAREIDGKIAILYGLRRTGKTTLLFQMISELPLEKSA